jgi:hypothetical protein
MNMLSPHIAKASAGCYDPSCVSERDRDNDSWLQRSIEESTGAWLAAFAEDAGLPGAFCVAGQANGVDG